MHVHGQSSGETTEPGTLRRGGRVAARIRVWHPSIEYRLLLRARARLPHIALRPSRHPRFGPFEGLRATAGRPYEACHATKRHAGVIATGQAQGKCCTRARNWSPRSNSLRNMPKLVKPGESSTTSPGSAAARAAGWPRRSRRTVPRRDRAARALAAAARICAANASVALPLSKMMRLARWWPLPRRTRSYSTFLVLPPAISTIGSQKLCSAPTPATGAVLALSLT